MKFVLITDDSEMVAEARTGFQQDDELLAFASWNEALDACEGADLLFVDLLTTLEEPHKIGGYESFGTAKMDHAIAAPIPVVLIAPPEDYELDFMAGWPDFVFAHLRRPVPYKLFRRASTWV